MIFIDSSPCLNNGVCYLINGSSSQYGCYCQSGYNGKNCENVVNLCSLTTCLNGGTCIVQNGIAAVCLCTPGWAGLNCGIDIPECNSQPCLNGATCVELTPPNIKCYCPYGFTGQNRELQIFHADQMVFVIPLQLVIIVNAILDTRVQSKLNIKLINKN